MSEGLSMVLDVVVAGYPTNLVVYVDVCTVVKVVLYEDEVLS